MAKNIFSVGLTVLIETSYQARFKTQIVGWKEDGCVIVDAVYVGGQPAQIPASERCKVRFLKEDRAYGFGSQVLAVHMTPLPLMYLKYPQDVESVKLQIAPRYTTDIPARLLDGNGMFLAEGTIYDLSEGGCAIRMRPDQELSPDATYAVSFLLGQQELALRCRMRTVERAKETCSLGMQFIDVAETGKNILHDFLAKLGSSGTTG